MSKGLKKLSADVVIAGGGPGGCAIAKDLSKKGKKVILLEKGRGDKRFLGTPLGPVTRMEMRKVFPIPDLRRTKEGENLVLCAGVGGGTLIYGAAAFMPDYELWKKYGVDIPQDLVDEAMAECWVHQVPDDFIGPGTKRLWEAAQELGIPFHKQYKFIDYSKCKQGCDSCFYGCKRGAKWTGLVFADEAVKHGATILPNTLVREVIIENRVAVGVRARGKGGQRYEISAKAVVCSAGGAGTVPILKRSGLYDAGQWFAGDAAVTCSGLLKEGKGNTFEQGMSVGYHDKENGCTFAVLSPPPYLWHVQRLAMKRTGALKEITHYKRLLGVMCKISDEGVGSVTLNGGISRTMTARDRWRFDYGRITCEKILTKAGCDPYSVSAMRPLLGHPGLTVRIGKLLDSNLETEIKNLYCCDTSALPEAVGVPPAFVVVVLGKRLARRLENIV